MESLALRVAVAGPVPGYRCRCAGADQGQMAKYMNRGNNMLDNLQWESVPDIMARELTKRILPELSSEELERVHLNATSARLPFYMSYRLYRLGARDVEEGWPLPVECYALWNGAGEAFLINGESASLHAANEAAPLVLTPQNMAEYIRFFLFGVRGGEGPFILVEAPPRHDGPGKGIVAAHASPLAYLGQDESGRALYKAILSYIGGLFSAVFAVAKSGDIEMLDDEPLVDNVPSEAIPSAPDLDGARKLLRHLSAATVVSAPNPVVNAAQAGSPRPLTKSALLILTELLLERALVRQTGNRLITHFNAIQTDGSGLDQFAKLMVGASPIVAVETSLPYVEEIIAQIIREKEGAKRNLRILVVGDSGVPDVSPALVLLPLQTSPQIPGMDRVAHDLATKDVAAIITCETFSQVPESLRVITDIVLKLPAMDATVFEELFEQVIGAQPPANWRQQGDVWSKYVLHTDFEHPRRMQLPSDKAFEYIRGQVTERMTAVDPVQGLGLKQLHGLGEARQFAEDLIADIHAAIQGQIPWTQVDRGALLVGPPGTGKTTLAKAIAKDCNVKFVQGSAAAWQSTGNLSDHIMAIRRTFAEARRYSPSILFIDEIDSLGNRDQFTGQNASYNTEVVNAVLEQIQGLDAEAPVFVLGATNHEDRVDAALKRSGRMDRVIRIPRPNSEALGHIYGHYLGNLAGGRPYAGLDLATLGKMSVGLTGADVERIVRGAARRARKEGRLVSQLDVIAEITNKPRNPGNNLRLTPEELERTAYHESGHAMALYLSTSNGSDIGYVTIVPRDDGTLGFVATLPDERVSFTRNDYQEKIKVFLAGRAAEAIFYGEENVSSSASSDLQAATALALEMVTRIGLGQERKLLWSAEPTTKDREEAEQLLSQSYDQIAAKLHDSEAIVKILAEELIARQELAGSDVRRILSSA